MSLLLTALGYEKRFDLKRAVKKEDTVAIDEAFAYVRGWIDKSAPKLDRFQKAMMPWLASRQLQTKGASSGEHRFVILDEMNIARVEYYFAEFLSVLESDRDPETGDTIQAIPLHGERGVVTDGEDEDAVEIPGELQLPEHLFVVGTVNTDETTHAFSPKVLDRAFTLEFNEVDLAASASPQEEDAATSRALGDQLAALLTASSAKSRRKSQEAAQSRSEFLDWLLSLNAALEPHDLHFAYRVRDEIARFVGFALTSPLRDGFGTNDESVFRAAFDTAVLMKVLPKFHGSKAKLTAPLISVLSWAADPADPDLSRASVEAELDSPSALTVDGLMGAAGREGAQVGLPRTAHKAARMLYECVVTGFTSFA